MSAARILAALTLFLSLTTHADELQEISQLVNSGQFDVALSKLDVYLAQHPKDLQAQFLKGVTLTSLNRQGDAIAAYKKVIEQSPDLPEPYNNLAVIYAQQGQYDKARQVLQLAINSHPSYATSQSNLSEVYSQLAVEAYDKALTSSMDKNTEQDKTKVRSKLVMIKSLLPADPKAAQAVIAMQQKQSVVLVAKASSELLSVKPTTIPPASNVVAVAPVVSVVPKVVAVAPKPVEAKLAEVQKPAELNTPPVKVAPVVAPAVVAAAVSKPEPEKPMSSKPTEATSNKQALDEVVQNWASAWSKRDVGAYLGFYASNFVTPNGESRKEWEDMRRDRITKPKSISVEVTDLKVQMESDGHARVRFKQSYRAGSINMRTAKTLVLKQAGNRWRIEQELADH